jgi:xanthine dehydrogenase accessory factor
VLNGGNAMRERVLIKGAGELASATAHRLFRCGFRVVMTDLERPTAVRRTVSFCSAIYDREIEIEGVRGVGRRLDQADALARWDGSHIPVFVDPGCRLRAIWRPDVIVDARLLKRNLDNDRGDAGLVIGLGPGLEAGRDVHYVVETNRGHHLGRILEQGAAASDTGQPGDIGGYTWERVLVAPIRGVFHSEHRIGSRVRAGDVVGSVAGHPVTAAIPGVLRGLVYPGLEVAAHQKLGDVDPRGDPSYCHTFSDKARTISGSVLEIVIAHVGREPQTAS